MYDEQQRLSRLITDVYNAALNPSFWVDVLRSAAGFVGMAAMESPYVPEVIARSYRLTPTELRVLLALVEVGGVSEVAATLGIARTTVKMHLRRLFEKTDIRRQADLVKLVAGFSSPLAR